MSVVAVDLLKVVEIAELAGVHKDTVYDWIARGELRSVDLGHGRAKTRIRADDWNAFVESRTTARTK